MHDQSTPRNEGGQNASRNATPETDSRYPPRPCAHCGTPFTARDKHQRFCSRPCVWADARARLATMQAEGTTPHTAARRQRRGVHPWHDAVQQGNCWAAQRTTPRKQVPSQSGPLRRHH